MSRDAPSPAHFPRPVAQIRRCDGCTLTVLYESTILAHVARNDMCREPGPERLRVLRAFEEREDVQMIRETKSSRETLREMNRELYSLFREMAKEEEMARRLKLYSLQ
ncbi:unnamed protein product [Mycena citricolor]|uniref:Uncharacterized protein n=1 Tax=Mycena citricolor TaxID=2018698 RepID=A0AAD2JVF3_9AGAR|nr:unnamed protein product [Mycena citricolor]